jgi:penicillin-binding protein 2B
MKKKKRKNNIRYSKILILGSLFLFCLMIGRVIQLGLSTEVDGTNLKELASKRTTRTDIISANRGSIYSSNGDVLAQNVASYKLIAYLDSKRTTNEKKPQHVVNKEETAEKLAPILGMEKDEILG